MDFSTLTYLRGVYERESPLLEFRADSAEAVADWKGRVREKLRELLGEWPSGRCELSATLTGEWCDEGFLRQRVVFYAEEDVPVPCYVLVPDEGRPPYPTLLCIHGHGRGKDDVVGMAQDDEGREHIRGYNYDYARQFARRGYLCVCPDMRAFGERAERDGSGCRHAFLNALIIGRQLKGMQLWDVFRAVDYALTREDADGERLGCVGLSMGGELTVYAALLDERVRCAVSSCFVRVFKPELYEREHCPCSCVAGLLKWFDLDDLACAVGPTPLLLEVGTQDTNTPVETALEACRKVERCYQALGVPERTDSDVFEGGHEFSGRKAFGWFDRWLKGRERAAV